MKKLVLAIVFVLVLSCAAHAIDFLTQGYAKFDSASLTNNTCYVTVKNIGDFNCYWYIEAYSGESILYQTSTHMTQANSATSISFVVSANKVEVKVYTASQGYYILSDSVTLYQKTSDGKDENYTD